MELMKALFYPLIITMTAIFKQLATNARILYYVTYVFGAVHDSFLVQEKVKFKNVLVVKIINYAPYLLDPEEIVRFKLMRLC